MSDHIESQRESERDEALLRALESEEAATGRRARRTAWSSVALALVVLVVLVAASTFELSHLRAQIGAAQQTLGEQTKKLGQLKSAKLKAQHELETTENDLKVAVRERNRAAEEREKFQRQTDEYRALTQELAPGCLKQADAKLAAQPADRSILPRSGPEPRIYLQIEREDDRAFASAQGKTLSNAGFLVLGIQRVPTSTRRLQHTEVRYYRDTEKEEANRIVDVLKRAGVGDAQISYLALENKPKLRLRQYEVWFSAQSGAQSPRLEDAKTTLEKQVREATSAYNQLFKQELPQSFTGEVGPARVELLPTDAGNAYTDGTTYFAPPEVVQLPEITSHNVSWIFLARYVPVFSQENMLNPVLYSYADILPFTIRQRKLVASRDPDSWELYAGGVAWLEAATRGRRFKLNDDLRPLRSLSTPEQPYSGTSSIGSSAQITSFAELKPDTEAHVGAGIGAKAFYLTAQRAGTQRAETIWLRALEALKGASSITYPVLAKALLTSAKDDADAVRAALTAVGLGAGDP